MIVDGCSGSWLTVWGVCFDDGLVVVDGDGLVLVGGDLDRFTLEGSAGLEACASPVDHSVLVDHTDITRSWVVRAGDGLREDPD